MRPPTQQQHQKQKPVFLGHMLAAACGTQALRQAGGQAGGNQAGIRGRSLAPPTGRLLGQWLAAPLTFAFAFAKFKV